MGLRIGLVADQHEPEAGGQHIFVRTLFEGQTRYASASAHTLIPIGSGHGAGGQEGQRAGLEKPIIEAARAVARAIGANTNFVRSIMRHRRRKFAQKWLDGIEAQIAAQKCDFVWFLAPPGAVTSVPFATTVWDLEHRKKPYFPEVSTTGWDWEAREAAYRAVLPRASIVVTGTERGKQELITFYGINPENVAVLPMPVPLDLQNDQEQIDSGLPTAGRPFLLYPAQFWPHKNHANLIAAVSLVRKTTTLYFDVVLVGADKGVLGHVKKLVEESGLSDRIHFAGFVPRDQLVRLYRNASALIYPSFFGPDNIPPLEAFALGCPVLISSLACADEEFFPAVLRFDPYSAEAMANAIRSLFHDRGEAEKRIERGRIIASKRSVETYLSLMSLALDRIEVLRACWPR